MVVAELLRWGAPATFVVLVAMLTQCPSLPSDEAYWVI